MNLRILIAAITALSIHGILFIVNFEFLSKGHDVLPATNVIRMTLSSQKQKAEEKHNKLHDINVKNNKNTVLQKQHDKEKRDAKNAENFDSIAVIHKAKPLDLSNNPPAYPRIARLRGYQGTVILKVLINRDGMVSEIKIVKSSGYWILDKSAITAVKDWKFEPGSDGTKKVDMWVEQPIRFQLK